MGRLMPKRNDLSNALRDYGEDDLADRVLVSTDEEMERIAVLGFHYAFSAVAMEHGGSMGGARALSLAALDVLDGTGRDLCRARSSQESSWGLSPELSEHEVERIRAVRSTAPR